MNRRKLKKNGKIVILSKVRLVEISDGSLTAKVQALSVYIDTC